jgi:glycosyltransferase involved in cell wall biosynthesis
MAIGRARIKRGSSRGKLRIRLEGEFGLRHSFGHVTRELALAILGESGIDLRLRSLGPAEVDLREDPKGRALLPFFEPEADDDVDIHIRHHWPPNFEPPPTGRWVLAQPWEFGSLPKTWVEAFRDRVDDVWCFTRYVQDAYLRAGFDRDRTAVTPHGIDPEAFRLDVKPYPVSTERTFKFLFVGGTLYRKGADLLLEAYLRAFSSRDDVALVVKDMGTRTFYQNQTTGDRFLEASRDPTRPEIVYLDEHLSEAALAGLYRACNALVAPYRGEGFALPVLEAMACGLHVITTGGGATDDFVDGTCGTRIVSDKRESTDRLGDGTRCVAPMFYMEPDKEELIRALRWAYEHPEEGKRLGKAASHRARHAFTWDHTGRRIVERLKVLASRPIARSERAEKTKAGSGEKPALRENPPVESMDARELTGLEVALMRGDLQGKLDSLERILSREKIASSLKPLLDLLEKTLRSEKGFAIRGISNEAKGALLGKVSRARNRIGTEEASRVDVSRPRVSLTMIVRDEESNIAECLKSVRDAVDELIVVDTGSKDRTKVISSALGAKVFDFPWVDSFARARNEAIRHATGDWIFWLDADDRVDPQNRERLQRVFSQLPRKRIVGYSMSVECVATHGASPTVVDHVRLFPRHSGLRWEYRVHENILPAINRLGGEIVWTDVTIHHYGYLDSGLRDRKRRRDHALLAKNLEESPDDPFIHFNLGHSFIDSGQLDLAAKHLRESIARSEPHYSQVKKAYVLLAQVERGRGDGGAALSVIDEGRKHHPGNPELLYFSGVYLQELGRLEEAAARFRTILETRAWVKEFSSFDIGILGHKAKHRLAQVLFHLKRTVDAEALLREVLESHPEYVPAMEDMGRVLLESGQETEAKSLVEKLRGKGCLREAFYLEALLERRAGNHEGAAHTFQKALELDPDDEELVSEVTRELISSGGNERAAAWLRDVVEERPQLQRPRCELGRVLFQAGRLEEAMETVNKALSLGSGNGTAALREEIIKALKHAPEIDGRSRREPNMKAEERV